MPVLAGGLVETVGHELAATPGGGFVGIVTLVAAAGILLAYAVRVLLLGRALDARVLREPGTALLGRFPMEAFHWALRGLGRLLTRTSLTPDELTLASLLITLACVPLAAIGQLQWAGLALIVGSSFDALDGILARERRISSDAGEVLDAIVDRYADAAPLVGLALFYRGSIAALLIVLFALCGSFLVSYVRAKAEIMGISLPAAIMCRQERIVYLAAALLAGPLLPEVSGTTVHHPATLVVVALVGLLANYSAVRLTVKARSALRHAGRGPGSPVDRV